MLIVLDVFVFNVEVGIKLFQLVAGHGIPPAGLHVGNLAPEILALEVERVTLVLEVKSGSPLAVIGSGVAQSLPTVPGFLPIMELKAAMSALLRR